MPIRVLASTGRFAAFATCASVALTTYRAQTLSRAASCQDISNAGKRAGITGERSGLWAEFARIIGELRPRYVACGERRSTFPSRN